MGVIFSVQGKKICPKRIEAINNFPKITTLKQCQSFLGMLAFVSSFIPHFSTAAWPLFSLLKGNTSAQYKFAMTPEAELAVETLKGFLKTEVILSHADYDKPLYLAIDASQVGCGAFLYQTEVFDKTKENEDFLMKKYGFLPEGKDSHHLLPGVTPGKQTPIVTDFVKNPEDIQKFDPYGLLDSDKTMTDKIKSLEDKIIICKPISFFSKTFTDGQIRKYMSMEKEFLALMVAVQNFRGEMEAAPITFILSDNQAVCWALRHKNESSKLSRYLIKLFEFNISFVVTHLQGDKNKIADYLSRIYVVNEPAAQSQFTPRSAQHVTPSFPPLSVVTKELLLKAFRNDQVTECKRPDLCHLNVNSFLFGRPGPYCHEDRDGGAQDVKPTKVNKILNPENYGISSKELKEQLSEVNIAEHQLNAPELKKTFEFLKNNHSDRFFVEQNILKISTIGKKDLIVLPKSLVPVVLAFYHLMTHCGAKKLHGLIRLSFYWKNMLDDVKTFSKGCILCATFKHDNKGKGEIGTPRVISGPRKCWQMDIVSGLPPTRGYKSYLNFVDLYTGYTIPVPMKSETSDAVAIVIENTIIKAFGVPDEISCDNASNLGGPAVRKLLDFYNIQLRRTVPYSPTSHSLVESQNKQITKLMAIFSDQFQTSWVDAITLASLMVNSVPKPILGNHSPSFAMFGTEPFDKVKLSTAFGVEEHVEKMVNNRNFIRLLYELMVAQRIKNNAAVSGKYKSVPEGTLVYVRDHSIKQCPKVKPLFEKVPKKVIKEYRCVVYLEDLAGRECKVSKEHVKIAGDRTLQLFGNLPVDVKLVLGEPMDRLIWDELKNKGPIPEYLNDIALSVTEPRQLRGALPTDSHLVEKPLPMTGLDEQDEEDEVDIDDDFLFDDVLVERLNDMHSNNQLTNDTSLSDLRKSYDEDRRAVLNDLSINMESAKQRAKKPARRILRDMNPNAILDTRLRRRGEPLPTINE